MNRLPLRDRLQAAIDYVHQAKSGDNATGPAAIIAGLQADHAASYRIGASTNVLRVAGVNASCTWSRDEGLLKAWERLATIRLLQLDGRCSA